MLNYLRSIFTLLLLFPLAVLAQRKNLDFRYNIKKATGIVHIDGEIDASWKDCETASNFNMVLPMDTKILKKLDPPNIYFFHTKNL